MFTCNLTQNISKYQIISWSHPFSLCRAATVTLSGGHIEILKLLTVENWLIQSLINSTDYLFNTRCSLTAVTDAPGRNYHEHVNIT